jgi:N-acetylmuramoyl-L-alanine amidase
LRIKNSPSSLLTLAALLAGLLALASCAKRPPTPETGPTEIPGYTNLAREFGNLDFSPLQGRRIVLDPGHGGFFRGAVGPGGLTEAEVNLGVALYLRGLLEWAGAEVHLTRSADYDFLSPADSSLSSDLGFRINFANELQPDVFISIHHNSTASADPTINETQTYYPIGQEGASLDLARSIHRQLVLNLEISPAKILPGNFHVLRQAEVPAVLGEPAMISNPVIEGRLTLAASHDLEARAYFLGLLDYFAGGSPLWSGAQPDTVVWGPEDAPTRLAWTFQPGPDGRGPGPDPTTFTLTRDGSPVPFSLSADGHTVTWARSGELPHHPVEFVLTGRNLRNRATSGHRTLLTPGEGPWGRLDRFSEAAEKGKPGYDLIRWETSYLPDSPASGPSSGQGLALVESPGPLSPQAMQEYFSRTVNPPPPRFTENSQEVPAGRSLRLMSLSDGPADVVTEPPSGGWRSRLASWREWPAGSAGSAGVAVFPDDPVWMEARGALPLVDPAPSQPDTARTVAGAARYWVSEKLVPALYGAVIVLDPAGGGIVTDGSGPLGTRGADINLETALRARKLLEGAGATVHLTRTGEQAPPAQDKVRLAGQVRADLFLTIARSDQPGLTAAAHHPGSSTGQKWAEALATAAADLCPVDAAASVEVGQSWAYLLRHTACPALEASFPPLTSAAREAQATSAAWQQAEARVILMSAAAALGQDRVLDAPLNLPLALAALPGDLALTPVDWALVDGNFPWLPAGSGPLPSVAAASDSLSCNQADSGNGPGLPNLISRHTLEIHRGDSWQLWLLDYSSGIPQTRLLMEGP